MNFKSGRDDGQAVLDQPSSFTTLKSLFRQTRFALFGAPSQQDETTTEPSFAGDCHRFNADAFRQIERLSPRERQVLSLTSTGLTIKDISQALSITPRIVEIHQAQILGKLRAANLASAIKSWLDAGVGVADAELLPVKSAAHR